MSNLSDVKLIEKKYNIETYIANLRIKVKKFEARDLNEALLFKIKLLENKKNRKIYDIIEDKNILYIYISLEENIDDLLCGKITKESVPKGHLIPLKKKEIIEIIKKEESMCKIKNSIEENNELKNMLASGFFMEINIKGIPFNKCLITNNHVLNEGFFKTNKEIKIEYNNAEKLIQIGKRNIYTN